MSGLMGKNLRDDKRIRQAKDLLVKTLADYQTEITAVKEADPEHQKDYEQLIEHCSRLRGGNLFYPYLSSGIGKGALVELADGSIKYDFITGIGVHYLGHSHPKLLEASIDAALDDTVMQGNLQQGAVTVELLEMLVDGACRKGAKLKHCFLTSSGAMANENALKMIFQKHAPASRLLAFERCFSGRSMMMAQITDKPENREGLPKVLDVDYVPFFDHQDPKGSTARAKNCLNEHLGRHKQEYACMMFELIQGEGGYYPGEREFFVTLMDILKQNNIAIFVDEIQTFGRTPELFAFQYFGLDDCVDVVTIGKMTQVCATFFTDDYKPKPRLISQTFTASSSAIHAAKAIINELLNGGYLGKEGRIEQLHDHFTGRLKDMSKRHPDWIQGPFGLGGMIGMTAFDGSPEKAKQFLHSLFKNGVVAFTAGKEPVRIRFLMPIGAVTLKDIDAVCGIIEATLQEMASCS